MHGKRFFPTLVLTGTVICGFSVSDVQASSVSPSELSINSPATVLMIDGTDRNSSVSIRVWLDTPDQTAFDFGFMRNNAFVAITGRSRTKGSYTFAGGSAIDFALRNKGTDGLFGTSDDLIYRLSDSAGYTAENYFVPINPAKSRHPVVTDPYFHDLSLNWDLNHDGIFDAHVRLEIKGSKYDGVMPAPMAVSLPASSWLLGSGLAVGGVTLRRRKQTA